MSTRTLAQSQSQARAQRKLDYVDDIYAALVELVEANEAYLGVAPLEIKDAVYDARIAIKLIEEGER